MFWLSWGKAGRAVLQVIVLAVLARLVAPTDFGILSAAFVFIEFAVIFSHIGLGKAVVQQPSLRAAHIAVAFYASVILGLLLGLTTWFLAGALAAFFRIQALAPVLRVMSLSFPVRAISIVPESLLQRDLRFRWLANRELASYAVGYGCIGVALAAAGWGAWALVCAHLAQTAINTVLLLIGRPIALDVKPERQAFSDLLYFSGGYTLGRIANHFASQGDNLVVGRSLGPAALGVYGRAFQLMAVPADIFGDILDNVLFPTMAKAQDNTQRLANAYRRGISLIALLMLPSTVALYLLAPQIVDVILGATWTAAVLPLQLLALGLLFRTSCRMSDALTRAAGFVYPRAWRQGVYAVLVIGGAGAGQYWGVPGAACGVLVALGVNFFVMGHLSLKIANLNWNTFFAAHRPAALLAFSSGAMVYLISAAMLHYSLPSIAVLVGSIAVSTCAAIALVYWRPQAFLGPDGLWMIETLRTHFPRLQRLRSPVWPAAGVARNPPAVKSSVHDGLPRWFELLTASGALVLLSPLLVMIALLVALTSEGPILFRHRRAGKYGRHFDMLKFRTMRTGQSGPGVTKQGDARITPVGKLLRKAKLDEVPELWNVIRGDMSLVGPRPEAVQYIDTSSSLWQEILKVKPGVTDPVTLHLRNEEELLAASGADYETFYCQFLLPYKLRGYREFLNRRTWKRDIEVLWLTALAVLLPSRAPAPSPEEVVSSTKF